MSKLNFLVIFFFLFVYLFNLKISIPPNNLLILTGLLGGGIFLLKLIKDVRCEKFFLQSFFVLLLIPFSWAISCIVNGYYDFSYIKEIFLLNLIYLFSVYCFYYCFEKVDNDLLISLVGLVVFSQLLISFVAFISPSFFNFIFSIFIVDNLDSARLENFNEARMIGVGKAFFGSGVVNCLTLILLAFQISKSQKYWYLNIFIYIGIAVLGMLSSRTTIVGILLSAILLIKNPILVLKSFGFFSIILVLLFPLYNFLSGNNKFLILKDFGFSIFYDTENSQATRSLETLKSMFEIYPNNLKTWLFGDVYYRSVTGTGSYYMGTDVGFIRVIFSVGILGLFFYILSNVYFILSSEVFKNNKLICIVFIILFFILNFKGIANIYYFLILFLLFFKKSRRCD
ncbi:MULTISPECIES: hypothetical protein [unclassified Acinetobacter]|uniref:hypothetical protein n=1 Tax=unclassified Acinetobacter TaxID=196816 RepID=UPI0015D4126B|nr:MULTISPECIES: hypothetical protein [unclassified Acinetobacter]